MIEKDLFPLRPITFISVRQGENCPHCGENRVTDDIYGFITYLCGASRTCEQTTECEKDHYLGFIENEKDSSES